MFWFTNYHLEFERYQIVKSIIVLKWMILYWIWVFKLQKLNFWEGYEDKIFLGKTLKSLKPQTSVSDRTSPATTTSSISAERKQQKRSCKRSQKNRKITAFRPSPSTFTHVNTNKKQIIQQRPAVCLDRFVLRHCLKLEERKWLGGVTATKMRMWPRVLVNFRMEKSKFLADFSLLNWKKNIHL